MAAAFLFSISSSLSVTKVAPEAEWDAVATKGVTRSRTEGLADISSTGMAEAESARHSRSRKHETKSFMIGWLQGIQL